MLNSERRKKFYQAEKIVGDLRNICKKLVMARVTDGSYGSVHDLIDYIISMCKVYRSGDPVNSA